MISRAPLRDEVYRQILDRIHRGDLPPGSRVRDADLAAQLGVSRTPIREALLRLARDGVLDTAMGRGFRVRPIDAAELREVGDILGALESLALRLSPPAARRSGSTGSARWTGGSSRPVGTSRAAWTSRTSGIAILLEECPNRRLLELIASLRQVPRRYLAAYMRDAGRLSLSTLPHQKIAAGARGAGGDSVRGSIRAAVAARRRGARGLGRPDPPRPGGPREAAGGRPGACPLAGRYPRAASAAPTSTTPAPRWCPRPVRQAVDAHLDLEDELGGYEASDARADGAARRPATPSPALLGAHRRNVALSQNSTTAFAQALDVFDFASGDVILTSRADYASNQIMYLSLARRLGRRDRPSARSRRRRGGSGRGPRAGPPPPADARGAHLGPHQLRPGPGGARRGRDLPCRGDPLSGRRLPGGGAASDRRPGHRLRLPGRHGAQVPPGPPRHRLPLRVRPGARGRRASAAGRHARRHLDRSRPLRADPRCPAVRVAGRSPTRWCSAWAQPPGTRSTSASRPPGTGRGPWRPTPARGWPRYRACGCSIAGASSAPSSPRSPGSRSATEIKLALRARGINTSSPDRDDAVIDMDEKGAGSAIRISPHYYNTAAEIDTAVEALAELLRSSS